MTDPREAVRTADAAAPETNADALRRFEAREMASFRAAGVVVLLLSAGLLLSSAGGLLASLRAATWPETEATVTRCEVGAEPEDRPGGSVWTLTVEYTYVVEGTTYTGSEIRLGPEPVYETKERAEAAAGTFLRGETHPVYHDPRDPARSVLVREAGVRAVYTTVASGGLAVIGIWLLRPSRRETRPSVETPEGSSPAKA